MNQNVSTNLADEPGIARWQFAPKVMPIFEPHRYKIMYGGRGALKSWTAARYVLIRGYQEPIRILCARETMNSIKESVHQLLRDQSKLMGLGSFWTAYENNIIGANGSEIIFRGLRKGSTHAIRSLEGIKLVWVEEAEIVTKDSWSVLTPTVRVEDSEIMVTFNPDLATSETYQRFVVNPPSDAIVLYLTSDDNPWLPNVLVRERDEMKAKDFENYQHVWLGHPKKVVDGAIYATEVNEMYQQNRFRDLPYDPNLLVHCIWDLGFNDAMSIIMVQKAGTSLSIIDYIEDNRRTYASYVQELNDRKYVFGNDWLPHDGASHDPKEGTSAEKVLRGLGRKPRVMPRGDIEDGIKVARGVFARCYFDSKKAVRLVEALSRYRRAIPDTTGEPGRPIHDQWSHGADAFRILGGCAHMLRNDIDKPVRDVKRDRYLPSPLPRVHAP